VQANLACIAVEIGLGHFQRILKKTALHCRSVHRPLPSVVYGAVAIAAVLCCLRRVGLIGKYSRGHEEDQNGYVSAQWSPLTVMAASEMGRAEPLGGLTV
jgi:hypothetical protein